MNRLAGVRIEYPVHTICMAASQGSNPLIVNPLQSFKPVGHIAFRNNLAEQFTIAVHLDHIFLGRLFMLSIG